KRHRAFHSSSDCDLQVASAFYSHTFRSFLSYNQKSMAVRTESDAMLRLPRRITAALRRHDRRAAPLAAQPKMQGTATLVKTTPATTTRSTYCWPAGTNAAITVVAMIQALGFTN